MNAGDSVPLFAGMLTNRPWEEITQKGRGAERLQLKYTEEEAAMIQVGGVVSAVLVSVSVEKGQQRAGQGILIRGLKKRGASSSST